MKPAALILLLLVIPFEDHEIEIVLGKKPLPPQMNPDLYRKMFKPKEALELKGEKAGDDAVRKALKGGVDYVLGLQKENGSWSFNARTQLRDTPEAKKARAHINLAKSTLTPVAMTSLACMALRANGFVEPKKIHDAVKKGRDFLIENAVDEPRGPGQVWAFTYALQFLSQECRREKDEDLLKTVNALAERLLSIQHKGTVSEKAPPRPGGGFSGIVVIDVEDGEGARVFSLRPKCPAAKAGVRRGDIVTKFNGENVKNARDFNTRMIPLKPDEKLKLTVTRDGDWKPGQRQKPRKKRRDGGWTYLPTPAIGCTTAASVLALLEAREAGARIPQKALDRAAVLLERMKRTDPETGEPQFDYVFGAGKFHNPFSDIKGSMGRIAVMNLALYRMKRLEKETLETSGDLFRKYRGELDKVLGFPSSHFIPNNGNAAYYHLFGHHFAAKMATITRQESTAVLIQEALLKMRHDEGTWTDHEVLGRLSGTCQALMALGELKWLNPGLDKTY